MGVAAVRHLDMIGHRAGKSLRSITGKDCAVTEMSLDAIVGSSGLDARPSMLSVASTEVLEGRRAVLAGSSKGVDALSAAAATRSESFVEAASVIDGAAAGLDRAAGVVEKLAEVVEGPAEASDQAAALFGWQALAFERLAMAGDGAGPVSACPARAFERAAKVVAGPAAVGVAA